MIHSHRESSCSVDVGKFGDRCSSLGVVGNGKQSSGKGKQSKSWSKSDSKGKSKESKGKLKGTSQGSKGPTVRTRAKSRKLVYRVRKTPKSETSSETQESAQTQPSDNSYTDNSWCDDGWSYDEWNDNWSTKVGHKPMTTPQAHFHLEVLILVP